MSICFFFCKQKTAYEMRISDWSSDVCSSDLIDTDDRQTSILPVVIQTLQVRHRLLTWRTPARPEIDVDDAAVQPGQRNRIVTERRRAFARRDGQCPGAEQQQQQAAAAPPPPPPPAPVSAAGPPARRARKSG